MTGADSEQRFQIFRAAEAPDLVTAGCMSINPMTDVQSTGMQKLGGAGYLEGEEITVLVNIPGFSLTHVWFKKDFPLPLHSHDADCLYYIIAGSIHLGTEKLGPRDGFFIPSGVPYTYRPGPEGVELLEFRHANQFDFQLFARNQAFYDKAVETVTANREIWRTAKPPALNA